MVDQDVKTVSSATGTFPALRPRIQADEPTGKSGPPNGKDVPAVEPKSPDLEELAEALNVASQSIGRDLRFKVDMESGQSVIQVLDRETGEVIRQIPAEKAELYSTGNGALQLWLINNHA